MIDRILEKIGLVRIKRSKFIADELCVCLTGKDFGCREDNGFEERIRDWSSKTYETISKMIRLKVYE